MAETDGIVQSSLPAPVVTADGPWAELTLPAWATLDLGNAELTLPALTSWTMTTAGGSNYGDCTLPVLTSWAVLGNTNDGDCVLPLLTSWTVVGYTADGNCTIPSLTGWSVYAVDTEGYCQLPALTSWGVSATGSVAATAVMTLPMLTLTADGPGVDVTLPAITVDAQGHEAGSGAVDLPLIESTANGLTGTIATALLELPAPSAFAGAPGSGDVTLPLPELASEGLAGTVGTFSESLSQVTLTAVGSFINAGTADLTLPLLQIEGMLAVGSIGTLDVELRAMLLAADGLTGQVGTALLELPIIETDGQGYCGDATVSIVIPLVSIEATGSQAIAASFKAWVLNTKNQALTEYTNYAFNSFAKFNGVHLAAGASGIFALTGDLDHQSALIAARAKLGLLDFGIIEQKRVEEVFFAYRSEGVLKLTVRVDGDKSYTYTLQPTGKTGIKQARVKVGKGIKSKYIGLEVANVEGKDFDLDQISLTPVVLSRKLG